MAKVRFFRGIKSKYSSQEYQDSLYFSTDTNEIILNDISYSGVTGAQYSEETNILTLNIGSEVISVNFDTIVNTKLQIIKDYTINGKKISSNPTLEKADIGLGNVTNDPQVKRSEMGYPNGVATLGDDGKVPSSQLPSYVDDVIEIQKVVDSQEDIPKTDLVEGWLFYSIQDKKLYKALNEASLDIGETPESGKIYIAVDDNNKQYRWAGDNVGMVTITSGNIVLGETQGTAYEGSKGKEIKDSLDSHISNYSNPHKVSKDQIGLGNVENISPENLPISTATQEALNTKVDKKEGYSLVQDEQITKLTELDEQSVTTQAIADAKKAGTDASAHLENITGQTTDSYIANSNTNYINTATSLNNADILLDAQIKKNQEAISALSGESGTIQEQISSAINSLKGGVSEDFDTLEKIEKNVKQNTSSIETIQDYTVNNKKISSNPVLTGEDIQLTGYTTVGSIEPTDTVNQAIGKLEEQLVWHEVL